MISYFAKRYLPVRPPSRERACIELARYAIRKACWVIEIKKYLYKKMLRPKFSSHIDKAKILRLAWK